MRHKAAHLPAVLVAAKQAADVSYAGSVFERLQTLRAETRAILAEARAAATPMIALVAVGRIEKQLELEAKLLGQLNESARVAVGVTIQSEDSPAAAAVKNALSRPPPLSCGISAISCKRCPATSSARTLKVSSASTPD